MLFEQRGQRGIQEGVGIGAKAALMLGAALLVASGCGSAQDADRLPVYPTSGKITFKGAVPEGAYVALRSRTKAKAPNGQEVVPTAQVQSDGTFGFSSYAANDGAPAGEYKLTVEWHKTVKTAGGDPMLGPNLLPPQYSKTNTSPLSVVIAAGPNELAPIVLK